MSAPFAPGDRVYQTRRPESGSLIVDRCEQYADGIGWCVTAREPVITAVRIMAPAEYFRACPPDWTEPPQWCAEESVGYDAASEARWAEYLVDPANLERFQEWREKVAAWSAERTAFCVPGVPPNRKAPPLPPELEPSP